MAQKKPNETYITAESVCLLLSDIAHLYGQARYQKCELVLNHAAALGIELLFLPLKVQLLPL